jgi:hypothetical protein
VCRAGAEAHLLQRLRRGAVVNVGVNTVNTPTAAWTVHLDNLVVDQR